MMRPGRSLRLPPAWPNPWKGIDMTKRKPGGDGLSAVERLWLIFLYAQEHPDLGECRRLDRTKQIEYPVVKFEGRNVGAHILICTWQRGARPSGLVVSHICGQGHTGCVWPWHLEWDTPAGNTARMREHGTIPIGERHGRITLTEAQVREIRVRRAAGERLTVLGDEFGVDQATIYKIDRRRTWAWFD